MSSVNKVILLGNLGKDPEIRYAPSGDSVANLSIATTERFKDKSGEKREETEWHRVVFWGKIAEVCQQYLTKGSQVYIEGKIKTNKYKDKEGVERYSTEIRGDVMRMIGGKKEGGGSPQPKSEPVKSGTFDDIDDDIPF